MKIVIVGNIIPPSAAHGVATEIAGVTPPAIVAMDDNGAVVKTWTAGYSDAEVTAWAAKTTIEWPALDFYNKMTQAQRNRIRAAAKTDPNVDDLDKTLGHYIADKRMVRDDGGTLTQGLAYLVSTGVLTQAESDALVA